MIELHGQIAPVRLHGQLNKVPSESSGGPLQSKTAWPSHSQQIITPDDDYYGLASVKVEPVPRLPACVASVASDIDNILNHVVNIWAEVSAECDEYIQTHAKYGGTRLPLIPEEILAQYPHAFIYKESDETFYRLALSTDIWYYKESGGDKELHPVSAEARPVYKATLESDTWEFLENKTGGTVYLAYYNVLYASLTWTNFNIPSGSATATSYYKKATEPGLTL